MVADAATVITCADHTLAGAVTAVPPATVSAVAVNVAAETDGMVQPLSVSAVAMTETEAAKFSVVVDWMTAL